MIHRFVGVLLFLMLVLGVSAQQVPYATHYMYNLMSVNPGYAGASDGINVTGIVHNQWNGFSEIRRNGDAYDTISVSPNTNYISIDAPISFLRGGIGGNILQDNLGEYKNIFLDFGYAFRTSLFGGELGVGPKVSLFSRSINLSNLNFAEQQSMLSGEQSDMIFDLGAGAYWEVPGQMYVGLSVDRILESQGKKTNYKNARHYFLNAGYKYILPNKPEFEIEPSLMFIYDGVVMQYFFGSMVKYQNRFWGGLSYSLQNDLATHLGFYYKDFRVGLSYGLTTSRILKYSHGTFEIMLNYNFKIEVDKIRNSYKNTRFL